jgi:hypothetical protein
VSTNRDATISRAVLYATLVALALLPSACCRSPGAAGGRSSGNSAVVQRALIEGLKFGRCMRNDGVPNWPDPTVDSIGRPSFQVTAAGISIAATRSTQLLEKIGHCESQTGALLLRQE